MTAPEPKTPKEVKVVNASIRKAAKTNLKLRINEIKAQIKELKALLKPLKKQLKTWKKKGSKKSK